MKCGIVYKGSCIITDNNDFEEMVRYLQKKIEYDEEKTYSKIVIQEYRNPTYFGILDQPDAVGQVKGPCGDAMKFSLIINNEIIEKALFWTDGCGATIASGNMLIKMIMKKTLKVAHSVTRKQVLDALGGVPDEHNHCALLAVNTLHKTINNYYNET